MPQIGWLEILIIVSIAIIVVGPKDFPIMLKKVGSWIGSVKRYVSNVQTEVTSMDDDVKDIYDKTDESNQKHNLNEKKDDIYSNIDEMLKDTLSEDENSEKDPLKK